MSMEVRTLSQNKFKKIGKADFNMAVLYFEILSSLMKEMSFACIEAETSLRNSSIIKYYSCVKQFYITLSPFILPDKETEIQEFFEIVKKDINVNQRTVTSPHEVILSLQDLQITLYMIAQQSRLLVPMSSAGNQIGDIERKFGLRKSRV